MPTISALARRFGLSRSTLLYYDRIGLLRPAGRTSSAYRQYGEADVRRLEQICLYRRAGVPLARIRLILEGSGQAAPILEARFRELERDIQRLRDQQRLLAGLLGNPSLLDGLQAMDKGTWVALLRASGFSEADMDRWHIAFEAADPERHQRFLELLGLSEAEVAHIRAWSARGPGPG